MPRPKDAIVKNVFWNFFGQGWLLVVAFFVTPYIVHRLGVGVYGILAFVGVVTGYFSFMEFGFGAALVKHIAQYQSQHEKEAIRRVFWSCVLVYVCLGSVGVTIMVVSAPLLIDRLFHISQDMKALAFFVLYVGAFGFMLSMFSGVLGGALKAVNRFDLLNRIEVLLGTGQSGMTVMLLYNGYSVKGVILVDLCIRIVRVATYGIFTQRTFPFLGRPCWDTKSFLTLLKYGGSVTISSIAGPVLVNTEKVFLGAVFPITALTYYTVPYSFLLKLLIIPSAISSVLFPAFSHYQSVRDEQTILELYNRGTLYTILLLSFPVMFLAIFSQPFLTVWMGRDFALHSSAVLSILAVASLINAMAYPAAVALQGLGRPSIPAAFHLLEVIIHVPVSYFLIISHGLVGAALAWLLRVVIDTALLHAAVNRLFEINSLHWYWSLAYRGFVPVFVCGLLLCAIRWSEVSLLQPVALGGLIAGGFLYGYLIWNWSLDQVARQQIGISWTHYALK
ncbi:MAG TPA: flippase [Nitrospiria bacterium]|nr:flippase [Nitrospiria bacterium]